MTKQFLSLVTVLALASTAFAQKNLDWVFSEKQETRVQAIEKRLKALEDARAVAPLPPAPFPAVAPPTRMATYPAPPGDGWTWTGENWTRPMPGGFAPAATRPNTAVAEKFPWLVLPSVCAGGQCPTRR